MPFPELQTKFFFTNDAWFWSFLQSFNEFHYKLYIFQTSGTSVGQLSNEEKKLQVQVISSYAFSKCKRDKSKVSLFLKRPAVTVMHGKNSTASDEKMQRFRIKTARTYVEPLPGK